MDLPLSHHVHLELKLMERAGYGWVSRGHSTGGVVEQAADQRDTDAALCARYAQGDAQSAMLMTRTLAPRFYGQALLVLSDAASRNLAAFAAARGLEKC